MSRVNYKLISNKEAVPVFKSNIFSKHKDKQFVAIPLGFGVYPKGCDKNLFLNYLRLRKNVYVNQTGMLDEDVVLSDNTEVDDDDHRSFHMVVAENQGDGSVAIIACQRLITKQDGKQLPIEAFFPEAFYHTQHSEYSIEVSRYISRAKKGYGYNFQVLSIMAKMMMNYVSQHNIKHIYGVIEEDLEKAFKKAKLPFKRIAEPKIVEEYNDYNLGIEINIKKYNFLLNLFALPKIKDIFIDENQQIFWGQYK